MLIESWKIDKIKPYNNHPRVNELAVAAVAKSIRMFGFRQPIVVDTDGVVLAGHTRLKAASILGMEYVDVDVAIGIEREKLRAFRLVDNAIHELSRWNKDLLARELEAVRTAGVDVSQMGFDRDTP